MKHLFIMNPVAGGRKGKFDDVMDAVQTFTKTLNAPYEVYETTAPMDACGKIVAEANRLAAEGSEMLYVYACGGDGTLNECANGAAGRANVAITHYPCGTGNDFIKMFVADKVEKFRDLKALSEGVVKQLDLIDCDGRYGINICSVGIDARVANDVHKYSNIPIIGGATGYVVALIVNIIKGVTEKMRITAGGKVYDKKITLACACNGRFYGGGFNPIPDALPDDGILECLVVEPISRFQVAKIVGRYSKGRFSEFPEVFNYIRGTEMKIEAERDIVVNIDGESIYTKKISFKLIPNGVNFIFPANDCLEVFEHHEKTRKSQKNRES